MNTKTLSVFFLLNLLFGFAANAYKCTLKGVTIGRESKAVFLLKSTERMGDGNRRSIKISNNAFEYTFDVLDTEAYQLIFKDEYENGMWYAIVFFPLDGVVNMKLHAFEQTDKNEIDGGPINTNYKLFKQTEHDLFKSRWDKLHGRVRFLQQNKMFYTAEHDSLNYIVNHTNHEKVNPAVFKRLTEMERWGDDLVPAAKPLKNEREALTAEVYKWRYAYIDAHNDLLSYYLIADDCKSVNKGNTLLLYHIQNSYKPFAALFPHHNYTRLIQTILTGFNKIKVGEHIINVNLPDVAGRTYSLSQLIANKYTLVDFWGSWCGPCIAATRTMLPVYNEFKSKGFAIVGIAKEYKSTSALKTALKREKYPWLNLVELDDKNQIWNKFGITNATGLMLLVDRKGAIVAIDPSAEEVRKILTANL